jgi:menaquinone-dependent protoporphyrinogen oxidase
VARILLLYSTVYGQSQRICARLQSRLAVAGHSVNVAPLGEDAGLAGHDAIVIGASIRHGKHNPAVLDFVRTQLAMLQSVPSAFFSVSLIARKPTRNTAESNPYLRTFLARSPWRPALVGVFAGELDYQRYGFFDRYAIRFIMTLTKGPTDLRTKVEFTDWDEVDRFAARVAALASGRAA